MSLDLYLSLSYIEIKTREKRNACLVHLLAYLHDTNFLMESKLDNTFSEYGNTNKMCALAANLMQKMLAVAEAESDTSVKKKTASWSYFCFQYVQNHYVNRLKKELKQAVMSASIPVTHPYSTIRAGFLELEP